MTPDTKPLETQLRSFYGLARLPFTKEREPEEIFQTPQLTEALERLAYLTDRRGTGALFAPPGTGKSTLLRAFLTSLGKTTHAPFYLAHTTCATLDLYRDIARGFQIEPPHRKADCLRQIKDRLTKLARSQRLQPLLIIDDAHLLPARFLDELRILTSFEQDSRNDLTLILAGHPQLEHNLRLAVNEALAQRIVLRVRLKTLSSEEVAAYLTFRLEQAGRTAPVFLPDAAEAISKGARGVLRLIDRLAEQCLLLGLRDRKKEIDVDIVTEAIDEVDL